MTAARFTIVFVHVILYVPLKLFTVNETGGGAGKEFTIVDAINTVPLKIEIVVAPGTSPVALNELPATEPGGGLQTMDVINEGVQAGLIDADETTFVQFTWLTVAVIAQRQLMLTVLI